MAIPGHVLANLEAACMDYRSKRIGIEQLQAAVWSAADAITAIEDRDLRRFLQNCESKLELLRFTVAQPSLFCQTLNVIGEVEQRLREGKGEGHE